jgi:hypothetical protein
VTPAQQRAVNTKLEIERSIQNLAREIREIEQDAARLPVLRAHMDGYRALLQALQPFTLIYDETPEE